MFIDGLSISDTRKARVTLAAGLGVCQRGGEADGASRGQASIVRRTRDTSGIAPPKNSKDPTNFFLGYMIYMGYLFIENHRLTMMHSKAVLLLEGLEQIQQTNLRSCPQGPTQYCVVDHCY